MSEPQVSEPRRLIVNADDFGQSPGVNRGVVQAHEHGIVASASLMVRWPAAAEAAAYARTRPELSVGLHLDLASGSTSTAPGGLTTRSSTPRIGRRSRRR